VRGTPFLFDGFIGGLNTIDSQFTIQDNESRDCLNVTATTRGAIRKRRGTVQFLSGTPPNVEFHSIAAVTIAGTRYLIGVAGNSVYSISVTGVFTNITGAAVVTAGVRWSIVQAPVSLAVAGQGPVYMSNGVDPPLQWTGSGNVAAWTGRNASGYYSTAPYVPNGAFMVFHQNRLWICGVTSAPSTVFYSDIVATGTSLGSADPSSFTATNTVGFDMSDGYPLTGIGDAGPYLLVTKEQKCWVITDPVTGANRQLAHNIGCVAHRTIQATPDGTFFLTADQGVFTTQGTTVQEASYKVRPTLQQITQAQRQNACAVYYRDHYYLSFPWNGSTTNNRMFDFDVQLKSWWLHDVTANEWEIFEPAGAPLLYIAVPGAGNGVAQAAVDNVFTDFGQPYIGAGGMSAYWFSAWQRFYAYFLRHRNPMPMVKKRVRQVYFNGSGLIYPMVFKNFNQGAVQWPGSVGNADQAYPVIPIQFAPNNQIYANADTAQLYAGATYKGIQMLWGGYTSVGDARIYAPGIAEEWSVGFGNNTADPFQVDAFAYMSQTRKS